MAKIKKINLWAKLMPRICSTYLICFTKRLECKFDFWLLATKVKRKTALIVEFSDHKKK